MVAITVSSLYKSYGNVSVIDDLNITIEEGEFVTLLGPSGCGKTTTLRCVAGLEKPTKGTIHFDEHSVVDDRGTFEPPNKRDLGMVFQSYALWPHMSVHSNVAYPLRMNHTPREERARKVTEALERVGLGHVSNRSVGDLSGGQQQRVALARAIVGRPAVMLFDEPLSNLDAKLRATMRTELQMLHREMKTTSIYVTHDQTEAMTLSDRIIVLDKGAVQQVGTPEEIYASPANGFVADFIGFENLLSAVVKSADSTGGRVVLGDGTALSVTGTGLREGETVTLAIRANAVKIAGSETESNTVAGEVRAAVYLGDQWEYLVNLGGDSLRVRVDVAEHGARSIHVGDRVGLALPAASVLVLS